MDIKKIKITGDTSTKNIESLSSSVYKLTQTVDVLARITQKGFDDMNHRFSAMDNRFSAMDNRFSEMDIRFDRLEEIIIEEDRQRIINLEDRVKQLESDFRSLISAKK